MKNVLDNKDNEENFDSSTQEDDQAGQDVLNSLKGNFPKFISPLTQKILFYTIDTFIISNIKVVLANRQKIKSIRTVTLMKLHCTKLLVKFHKNFI